MASVGGSSDTVSLNIMPMLDIFSILILFLLMNFSTDPVSHDINQSIELPDSITISSLDEIPALIVTRDAIFVNDKEIIKLKDRKIEPKDISGGGMQTLFKELDKLADANKQLAKAKGELLGKSGLAQDMTLEMDKDHEFNLLKLVMRTAQQADFVKFKLMVSKEID